MLNPVVSCVVYAIELLITYVFYSRISEKRVSSQICFIGGLVLFELGSLLNLAFHNNPWVNYIASIFIKAFFAFSFFEIKLFPSVCYAIILELLNFALELIVVFVISVFTHMRPADFNSNYALLMLECSMNKTLFFLTSLVLSGIVKPKTVYAKIPSNLFFYPISVTVCLGMFWYICAQSGTSYNTQLLLAISSLIIFGSTILLFITYQHQVEANSEYIRMKSEYNRLQTEKSYFDILEQQNQNLLIYAHDTKKHLAAIQALSDDPIINEYIAKLSDQLKTYTKNCHSGNMMLDVMINKYVMDCAHRGIHFEYNVRSCNLKEMEDIDLVAILGNLMDNALASAERSKQKSILLETTMRNGYSVLVVVNSCDTPPSTHGGSLITSKEDKKIHGFGLKSVSKVLSNYHGDFSWEYNVDTRIFTMTAMIGKKSVALNKFSIVPPIDAVFSYAGNGWHIFSATMLSVDNELLNGTIRCKYTESGKITHIEQHMLKFTIDSQGKIIPLDKACQAVYRGKFKSNTSFEQMGLTNVTVNSIKLEYEVDTKKFLQPVYAFYLTGKDYEERIIIPALQ